MTDSVTVPQPHGYPSPSALATSRRSRDRHGVMARNLRLRDYNCRDRADGPEPGPPPPSRDFRTRLPQIKIKSVVDDTTRQRSLNLGTSKLPGSLSSAH